MATEDGAVFQDGLDVNLLARKLDNSVPDAQALWVMPHYLVDKDGVALGKTKAPFQKVISGLVVTTSIPAGFDSVSIYNNGATTFQISVLDDQGTTQLVDIPPGVSSFPCNFPNTTRAFTIPANVSCIVTGM